MYINKLKKVVLFVQNAGIIKDINEIGVNSLGKKSVQNCSESVQKCSEVLFWERIKRFNGNKPKEKEEKLSIQFA